MSGMADRSFATWSWTISMRLGRRMRRSVRGSPCCSGMSKYGTIFGWLAITSIKLIADVARIRVHQPHPAQIVVRAVADRRQQTRQAVRLAGVASIVGRVLRHDDEFLRARGDERLRLVHDSVQRPAAQLALEAGNRAEGARRVAAVRNLQVRAAPRHGRARAPASSNARSGSPSRAGTAAAG